MKKILLLLLLYSCSKEPINIQVGSMYHIKNDVFNKGAFQPFQPVRVDSIYIDATYHIPYCVITDMNNVKWYIPKEDLTK